MLIYTAIFYLCVKLLKGSVGNNLLLMEDNARPHGAALVTVNFEGEEIHWMKWPKYSPDFNSTYLFGTH